MLGRACASVGTLEGIENPPPSTFSLNVARGRISGMLPVNKFGRNADIDVGTEDVWAGGGTWVPPTTARVHNLVSTSANDTSAGTGARTLRVFGLNASYALAQEDITLNGLVNVPTSGSYTMIYRMQVLTAGSGGTNVGTITATAQVDGTVTASVAIGKAQTQMAIYQVPAGYTAYLSKWWACEAGNANARLDVDLFARAFGGVYCVQGTVGLQIGSGTFAVVEYDPPKSFAAKTIIKLTGTADTNNTECEGGFDLVLVAD